MFILVATRLPAGHAFFLALTCPDWPASVNHTRELTTAVTRVQALPSG